MTITIAFGDGVGPEIMDAALFVLREAGADLEIETIEIGERIYAMGSATGILPSALESLERTRVLLKGPVIVPEGCRDVTAALREAFGLHETETDALESFAAAAHTGESLALFEPVQEPLPESKGKHKTCPAPMILAAAMMLRHIGQEETAEAIRKALEETLRAGIHTADIYRRRTSSEKVGTQEFAEAVAARLARIGLKRLA